MENPQRTPSAGFIGTPVAQALGLIIGLAAAFLMMAAGLYRNACLFVFVGVVLFVIPKLFGVKSIKLMVLLGVAFLLSTTFVGALVFSAPLIEENDENCIEGDYSSVTIVENGDAYDVSVTYTGTAAGEMYLYYTTVGTTSFKIISLGQETECTMTGVGNVYTYAGLQLDSGKLYEMHFEKVIDDENRDESDQFFPSANVTNEDIRNHTIKWNAYASGIVAVMFFLIVILTTWMRRNLEKTRAKMEAEGRLYPQGYGRCKECGMIVLPGETVCRKCGAYIDIPDEIKEKMKHKVEYIECSECGAEVPADARRCPKCGASFDEETEEVHVQVTEEELKTEVQARAAAEAESEGEYFECSECGAKVPADANKCPKCGAEFDEDEE